MSRRGLSRHARRIWKAVGIAVLAVFGILLLDAAAQVLLVIFGGLILAAYLTGIATFIESHSPLGPRASIALVLFLHALLVALFVLWIVTSGAPEVQHLSEKLPAAVAELKVRLMETSWGRALVERVPEATKATPSGGWVSRITGVMSTFMGAVASVAVLIFVGIYVAIGPSTYRRGLLHLVPPPQRARVSQLLDETTHTLRMWVLGRIVSGAVIGIGVWVGLSFLGIPLALLIGLISGAATFVPNIGPILSVVPPMLLALVESPIKALWVLLLYVGLQIVESYVLTPYIEKRAVEVPPAVLLAVQILLGVLTGIVGLAFAAPLIAVLMVATRRLYVEDVLEDDTETSGADERRGPQVAVRA